MYLESIADYSKSHTKHINTRSETTTLRTLLSFRCIW